MSVFVLTGMSSVFFSQNSFSTSLWKLVMLKNTDSLNSDLSAYMGNVHSTLVKRFNTQSNFWHTLCGNLDLQSG